MNLVVPTLSLYEVFKRILQQRGERDALLKMAQMHQGTTLWTQDAHFTGIAGVRFIPPGPLPH